MNDVHTPNHAGNGLGRLGSEIQTEEGLVENHSAMLHVVYEKFKRLRDTAALSCPHEATGGHQGKHTLTFLPRLTASVREPVIGSARQSQR
jgi:hypothetical protein